MTNKKEECDLLIIGAGVAGLSAGMYSARLGLKSIIFGYSSGTELPVGGTITTTGVVENYPGFKEITGQELAKKIKEHAESYEQVKVKQEKVISVEKIDNDKTGIGGSRGKEMFKVKTEKGEYAGRAILFATGGRWRKLEVPGGKEFENRGVAYCALCDAPLFKNKVVCVIGGSDEAAKNALVLSEHAKKVYIIYRKETLRCEKSHLDRVEKTKNIEIINNTNITAVEGKSFVERVKLDKKYKGKDVLEVDGVFAAIGHIASSELAQKIGVKVNEKEEIIVNHKTCETNIEGVYAAGDVTDREFKQAIIGVAEGCIAAHSAYEWMK
jgi:thioredoxin reductase (NADPH)